MLPFGTYVKTIDTYDGKPKIGKIIGYGQGFRTPLSYYIRLIGGTNSFEGENFEITHFNVVPLTDDELMLVLLERQ